MVETQREKLQRIWQRTKWISSTDSRRSKGPNTVAVHTPQNEELILHGEVILIGTGSAPHRAPEIPFDDEVVFDSDSILQMGAIPKSLAVIGGGVIGCEYASIFTALGVEVALVDGRDRVLPFLDAEISECLRQSLADLGVRFYFGERMSQNRTHPE